MSKTEPDTVRYCPHCRTVGMALRCGLNTWSVHAVLEHAACTPRPVHNACTRGLKAVKDHSIRGVLGWRHRKLP